MALELCAGLQARPGYLYFATNPACPGEVKIGRSVSPPSRVSNFNTTSPTSPWAVVGLVALPDSHAGEQSAKRYLQPYRLKHASGRDSEVFQVSVDTVISLSQALAKEQTPALEALCALQRAALGTGNPDYDVIAWVRNQQYGADPTVRISHAVRWASEGSRRHFTTLQKKGLTVVGDVAHFSLDEVPLLKASPFAFTASRVLQDITGFTVDGIAVLRDQLAEQLGSLRSLVAQLSLDAAPDGVAC